ncbi:MAG TPA: hypothetical protein VHV30_16650 [Polyangiaceae bacterium]|jgi:hypothetical protein|nr:hypothetical protein [Polyangiaceae bacterium]
MTRGFRASLHCFASCALLAALALASAGCTPHIGDSCALSTDCSVQGTLVCDTSQPGGYCTQLNCGRLSCPQNSTCVEFQASVPGCAYDDYQSPSRTGRSFCMENCTQASNCRGGYTCSDPRNGPWNGAILDDNQAQQVCIALPPSNLEDAGPNYSAAVCQSYGGDAETDDGGGVDGGADAGDGGADAGDGGTSSDAGTDATVEAGAANEGGADAGDAGGAADAEGGGG